jgi:hypothetical protein
MPVQLKRLNSEGFMLPIGVLPTNQSRYPPSELTIDVQQELARGLPDIIPISDWGCTRSLDCAGANGSRSVEITHAYFVYATERECWADLMLPRQCGNGWST